MTLKVPSLSSSAHKTMAPPEVLANAERVSQMLRGKAPLPSRPCAAFISRRLPSLNCPNSLRSNFANSFYAVISFYFISVQV